MKYPENQLDESPLTAAGVACCGTQAAANCTSRPPKRFPRWALFWITVLLFTPFAFLSVDFHHDGVVLFPALEVAAGKAVFRDVFFQYGILTPLLQGLVLRLTVPELWVLKWLTVVCYGLCAVELDRLWSRFLPGAWRWPNLILFWGLAPFYLWELQAWPSVYALYAMLLTGTCFLRWIAGGGTAWLIGSGIATGLAFGFRQPCGIVLLGSAGLMTVLCAVSGGPGRRRHAVPKLALFALGCGAVLALYAGYLQYHVAWRDYWQQTWVYPFGFGQERSGEGGGIPFLFACLFPWRSSFLLYPVAALLLLTALLLKRWRRGALSSHDLALGAVLLVGLAAWHQYWPVPCIRHFYWGAVPLFGALVYGVRRLTARIPSRIAAAGVMIAAFLWPAGAIALRVCGAWQQLAALPTRQTVAVAGLRGIEMEPEAADYFRHLERVMQALPPEFQARGKRGVLNLTPHAIFNLFIPKRAGSHPVYLNWGNVYPDWSARMTELVQTSHPAVISAFPAPFPGYRAMAGFPAEEPFYFLSTPIPVDEAPGARN